MTQAPYDLFMHGDGSCGQLGLGEDVAEKLRPFPLQIDGMKVRCCVPLAFRDRAAMASCEYVSGITENLASASMGNICCRGVSGLEHSCAPAPGNRRSGLSSRSVNQCSASSCFVRLDAVATSGGPACCRGTTPVPSSCRQIDCSLLGAQLWSNGFRIAAASTQGAFAGLHA